MLRVVFVFISFFLSSNDIFVTCGTFLTIETVSLFLCFFVSKISPDDSISITKKSLYKTFLQNIPSVYVKKEILLRQS